MTTFETTKISVNGVEVEVDLRVSGEEKKAESVKMHAHDEIVRALQAVRDETEPSECDGLGIRANWERRFEIHQEADQ